MDTMSSMNTMKRYIIVVLLTLIVSACGKMPINGDLDGRWQIMKIAYASGEEEMPERAYYSVALHTINLMKVDVTSQTGNMEYTGDSLFVVMVVYSRFVRGELISIIVFNGAKPHAAGSLLPSVSTDG